MPWSNLARDPAPARDALTGQTLSELPDGVKTGPKPATNLDNAEQAAKVLEDQLRQVKELT